MKKNSLLKTLVIGLSILATIERGQAEPSRLPVWWPHRATPTPAPAATPVPEKAAEAPTTLQRVPAAPEPVIDVPPGTVASPNDAAHFLAGMPVSSDSPLAPFEQTPAWQDHAKNMEERFGKLVPRFTKIATWRATFLPEADAQMPVAFYMFSGPDFLYVDQFFPNASVYVLCGTEPIGSAPDPLRLRSLRGALANLENSMNSLLRFSFFITKDMKTDLQQELKGTLPIFYVLTARANKTITDVTFIALNRNGTFQENVPGKTGGMTPGVRITYRDNPTGRTQTLFYFTTDISDSGIKSNPGFLKFCEHFGVGSSLLKASSYLMFESGFGTIRNFLLDHSTTIVQDDAGIPLTYYNREKWNLRLFGTYIGPIETFKQHFQPDLRELYESSNPPPLDFGFGYQWNFKVSNLIVAQRN